MTTIGTFFVGFALGFLVAIICAEKECRKNDKGGGR
jgi:hypothetical protein